MKNKWKNYALKDGKIKESYIRKYSSRSPKREAAKASRSNSLQQSGQKQAEEKVDVSPDMKEAGFVYKEPTAYQIKHAPTILNEAWVVNLRTSNESSIEEVPSEAYQEGHQGIQVSDQGRCEVEETNHEIKTGEEKVKKEKLSPKERKHEAKEGKRYEKLEDRREARKEAAKKKK